MASRKTIHKTVKRNPCTKKKWAKTILFATPGGIALAIMVAAILAGCAAPSSADPFVVNGKLMVDHQIIVPDSGILLQNYSKTGGAQ